MPRAKRKVHRFIIEVPALDTQGRMRDYIIDAVETWSGQFHPEDPLFGTLRGTVRVKSAARLLAQLDRIYQHNGITPLLKQK